MSSSAVLGGFLMPLFRPRLIHLRSCRPSDLDVLHDLDQKCFPPGIAYSREDLVRFIEQPRSRTWVAEDGGRRTIGFLVAGREPYRVGHIITIDVAAGSRRQGVGNALMDAAEEWSRRRDLRLIYLETAADNLPAQEFYRKRGYEKYRVIEHYYDNGMAAWVMVKWLAASPSSKSIPQSPGRRG